jgi:hypothetical protein
MTTSEKPSRGERLRNKSFWIWDQNLHNEKRSKPKEIAASII